MLASNVSKSIDDPGGLMVPSISKGGTIGILSLLRKETEICGVDEAENVLSPSNQVLPSGDIIPDIRKSVTPGTK